VRGPGKDSWQMAVEVGVYTLF